MSGKFIEAAPYTEARVWGIFPWLVKLRTLFIPFGVWFKFSFGSLRGMVIEDCGSGPGWFQLRITCGKGHRWSQEETHWGERRNWAETQAQSYRVKKSCWVWSSLVWCSVELPTCECKPGSHNLWACGWDITKASKGPIQTWASLLRQNQTSEAIRGGGARAARNGSHFSALAGSILPSGLE